MTGFNNKPRILVVDDVSDNIHVIMSILSDSYTIATVTSGEQALGLAKHYSLPDLILLDLQMPVMDGYEVLSRLKIRPETCDIPVIFMIASSDVVDETKGLNMGAVEYITKPVNPELLKLRITTQLELRRLRSYRRCIVNDSDNKTPQEQPSILIVDDISSKIQALITALSYEYRIMVVCNGAKAIDIVQGETPPDLILLDILMPDMDGYEVCRRIKTSETGYNIPILFLSALGETVDKIRGFSIGAADYITKPFDIDEVCARIRIHLELSRYRCHLEEAVKQATSELELKNAELLKLSRAVEQSPNSIMITDLKARIEYVNEAFVTHTGFSREEILGKTPRILQSGKMPLSVYDELKATLAKGQAWHGEFINRRKDGTEIIESTIIAPIRQTDGVITHYVSVEQDITQIKQAEDTIHRLTYFDFLTGLSNKNLLISRLDYALTAAIKQSKIGAVIVLNIDRFKNFIEARGHALGDACLITFGERISELLRPEDTLARVSADEFAIIMSELGTRRELASQQVISSVSNILDDLRRPFKLGVDEISVSASLGVALFPENKNDNTANILRRAGTALHKAKEAGGSQSAFFDTTMGEYAEQRFRIERELRRGIPDGELRLFLQPQVNSAGQIIGAEALVRWQHPERGLVPPALFIDIAEDSDLIVDLGIWVMQQACRLIAQEEQAGIPLNLSVNVSLRHFRQADFVHWLKQLLITENVIPSRLTLEITESLVIKNINDVIAKMIELRTLGVHFSIDDFGTGYSSLAYLKHLPIQIKPLFKTRPITLTTRY